MSNSLEAPVSVSQASSASGLPPSGRSNSHFGAKQLIDGAAILAGSGSGNAAREWLREALAGEDVEAEHGLLLTRLYAALGNDADVRSAFLSWSTSELIAAESEDDEREAKEKTKSDDGNKSIVGRWFSSRNTPSYEIGQLAETATVAASLGMMDEYRKAMDRAINKLRSEHARLACLSMLAKAQWDAGDRKGYSDSVSILENMVARNPIDADVLMDLFTEHGEFEKSLILFRKALRERDLSAHGSLINAPVNHFLHPSYRHLELARELAHAIAIRGSDEHMAALQAEANGLPMRLSIYLGIAEGKMQMNRGLAKADRVIRREDLVGEH